jgi:hypothetical protein
VFIQVSKRRRARCDKSLKGGIVLGEKLFNPNEHLRTLTRRKKVKDSHGEHWVEENHVYLDVKWRLIWFRNVYPEGFIQTVEVEVNDKFARIEATTFDKDPAQGGKKLGMGRRLVYACDFHDYVEKAETQAIGRALAVAGFGTQFCEEFDEEDSFADAPVEAKQKPHSTPPTTSTVSSASAAAPSTPTIISPATAPQVSAIPKAHEKAVTSNDMNTVYNAAQQKGLTRTDTDLFLMAKYQKMSVSDLTKQELDEFVAGLRSTPADKLRDFVDRYKVSLEMKNTAVA